MVKKISLIVLIFTIIFTSGANAGECTRKDTFDTIKNKNPQGETNIIIRVIDESTGELIPYPVIQLGRPYYTSIRQGQSCWICDDSKYSWTRHGKPIFESRPRGGVFIYKLGKNPLSGRFDPKRITSQSNPVKVCIRVSKPNCNYHHEGLATIHLGYDNYFKVFLDCPKRLKIE